MRLKAVTDTNGRYPSKFDWLKQDLRMVRSGARGRLIVGLAATRARQAPATRGSFIIPIEELADMPEVAFDPQGAEPSWIDQTSWQHR